MPGLWRGERAAKFQSFTELVLRSMKALFLMARPGNAAIAVVTLAAGYFLACAEFAPANFFADALAMALAVSFANIHNDILDFESDKVNRPNRPLPSGKVSKRSASLAALFCVALVIGIAAPLTSIWASHLAFYLPLLFALYLYNRAFKRLPLFKNMVVAALCATPLLRVALLQNADASKLYPAMAFAFLYTFAREILKDLEDAPGDAAAGIETFPVIVGCEMPERLASLLILAAWLMLPLPVLLKSYSPVFLFALLPLTPISLVILHATRSRNYRKAQKFAKIAMLLGLVALILSKAV